jgi:hypothetical protein
VADMKQKSFTSLEHQTTDCYDKKFDILAGREPFNNIIPPQ